MKAGGDEPYARWQMKETPMQVVSAPDEGGIN